MFILSFVWIIFSFYTFTLEICQISLKEQVKYYVIVKC